MVFGCGASRFDTSSDRLQRRTCHLWEEWRYWWYLAWEQISWRSLWCAISCLYVQLCVKVCPFPTDIDTHTDLSLYSPDWPRYSSHSPEIWAYLDKVCETFDLRKYMTFNTEVVGCYWNEDSGQWTVKLRTSSSRAAPREFEEKCDLLLHATGILNNFKWPEIEGLEKFKGKVVRESALNNKRYDQS